MSDEKTLVVAMDNNEAKMKDLASYNDHLKSASVDIDNILNVTWKNEYRSSNGDINDIEMWSECKKKAAEALVTNKKAFDFRLKVNDEAKRVGPWLSSEKRRFMELLLEFGAHDSWSQIASRLPSRVGYQVGNHYRTLVRDGIIDDKNYILIDKIKRKYVYTPYKVTSLEYRKYGFAIIRVCFMNISTYINQGFFLFLRNFA